MEDDEWFELEIELLLGEKEKPTKMKLCVDANVPQPFINKLRSRGIPLKTAWEDGVNTNADPNILAWVKRENRILITMDGDFWNNTKFPLQNSPGIIFIDESPQNIEKALNAFFFFYKSFGQYLGYWIEMKIRALEDRYYIDGRSWDGNLVGYEVRLINGLVLAREYPSGRPK